MFLLIPQADIMNLIYIKPLGPMGDFFKPCPGRAKAGFKKSPSE
jgi:hypothetical protein